MTTSIEWTRGDDGSAGMTWNPSRGCSRVSEGCTRCYAERIAARFSYGPSSRTGLTYMEPALDPPEPVPAEPFHTFAEMTPSGPRWTGKVALIPQKLAEPLRWRKPRRVFVNSMSDLFHEALPFEDIAAVFGVMAACPQHTFQVLTKRAARMREFFQWATQHPHCDGTGDVGGPLHAMWKALAEFSGPLPGLEADDEGVSLARAIGDRWPLPNVWLGVSVEDQKTADERIPELLRTPAAIRFVSYEPALGPVDFRQAFHPRCKRCGDDWYQERCTNHFFETGGPKVSWIIVGGESGPGARPFDLAWARSVRDQCKAAGVAYFFKQAGASPLGEVGRDYLPWGGRDLRLRDKKGGDLAELPEDLRVREFPEVRT